MMTGRMARGQTCRGRGGFSVTELSIAVIIMGILLSYAMPRFQKAFEQARVDLAATNLQTIWTAQRLYWAQNRTYATAFTDLQAAGLLDASFMASLTAPSRHFDYTIPSADAVWFQVSATRIGSSHWSGELAIDADGALTGAINGADGELITPSQTVL